MAEFLLCRFLNITTKGYLKHPARGATPTETATTATTSCGCHPPASFFTTCHFSPVHGAVPARTQTQVAPACARHAQEKQERTTPVGFEPTRGDPIGLAGRRLNRSAKVSLLVTTSVVPGGRQVVHYPPRCATAMAEHLRAGASRRGPALQPRRQGPGSTAAAPRGSHTKFTPGAPSATWPATRGAARQLWAQCRRCCFCGERPKSQKCGA